MEKIGTRLRLERERRGWTRLYVADAIDSDLQNIGRWERGETFPSPYYRQRLCSLFQMDAEALGLIRSNVRNSAGEMQEQITEDTQEHDLDNRPFSQHLVYPASQEDENLQTEEAPAPTWEGWRETTIPVPLQPQNLSKERRPFPSRTMIFIGIGLVLMVATLSWLIPLFWRLLASSPASSPYTLVTQPANSSQPVSSPITGTVTRQAGDSAAIVATSRPSTVRPNERFTIFFIVINNGNTIWSDVGKYPRDAQRGVSKRAIERPPCERMFCHLLMRDLSFRFMLVAATPRCASRGTARLLADGKTASLLAVSLPGCP